MMALVSSKKVVFFSYIWHGAFFAITSAMLDFNTIFPALIDSLTSNSFIFGSMLAILLGTPLIFNLIFSHYLKRAKKKRNFLLIGIYLRSLSFLSMALFIWLFAADQPKIAIISLYFFLLLFSVSAGFAGISYSDLIAKMLKDPNQRTKLYATKQIISSIAAFAGGVIVTYIFSQDLTYPLNYVIGLLIGSAGLIIAATGFWFVKEPIDKTSNQEAESLKTFFKRIPKILKDDLEFRKFIIIDNFSTFGLMIIPFYMLFVKQEMMIEDRYIGIYLLIMLAGKVLSSFIWGFLGKKWHSKMVVTSCMAMGGLIPILAILLIQTTPLIYGIVFFFVGMVISGRSIGFSPYLLDIAPNENRLEYLGIRGSLNLFIIILPLLAGAIIQGFGYVVTFVIVSFMMFMTVLFQILYKGKNIQKL
jgi:MFS family permease